MLLKSLAFTLSLILVVILSISFPDIFISIGNFNTKALIIPLLQIIMFGMGSQMSLSDFAGVVKNPKAVCIGIICQFSMMPIIALVLTSLFGFSNEIAAGIILVGASPSGLASNVMSYLAKANVALSVTLTAFATLLAPLMTPFIMQLLAGQYVPIDFIKMMIGIFDIVILPIIAGLVFNQFAFGKRWTGSKSMVQLFSYLLVIGIKALLTGQAYLSVFLTGAAWFFILPVVLGILFKLLSPTKDQLNKGLSTVSMVGIVIIIGIITASGRDHLVEIGMLLVLACLLHNVLGYTLGYLLCKALKLDKKSCRTIALEVGMQNSGMASGIALQMGKLATIGLASSIFGPLMNTTGSILASYWRKKE